MSKNIGKVFEENFKKSIPENIFCYRPPDAAQSFNMSKKLRFSSHSPCDYMIYRKPQLFCFELKTVAGNFISFERDENDKGTIHYYQIEQLKKFVNYGIISGLIIDFRKSDHTYFLNIKNWDDFISNISKKSFNENDLLKYSDPITVDKKKLKVNYRYNVVGLLDILEEKEYG